MSLPELSTLHAHLTRITTENLIRQAYIEKHDLECEFVKRGIEEPEVLKGTDAELFTLVRNDGSEEDMLPELYEEEEE